MSSALPGQPFAESWAGDDGTVFTLRPISPGDAPGVAAFVRELSFGTRYFRYGRGDFVPDGDAIARVLSPDPQARTHLVVVARDRDGETLVGSARYELRGDGSDCELAIVVHDRWHGHGVGQRLMHALLSHAGRRGLRSMHAHVLGSNARMLDFLGRQGFEVDEDTREASVKRMTRSLEP